MTVSEEPGQVRLNSLLLATDFSSEAEKAGLYAAAIAKRYGSEVRVIHVMDLTAAFKTPDAGICMDIFRRSGEEKLAGTRARLASAGVQAETILQEGLDTAKGIVRAADENGVDLIVSGTKGHGALARLALGSVAEQLIHHAECPVLTTGPNVKPPGPHGLFQRIVCATDFSAEAAKAARLAFSLTRSGDGRMFLCHVLPRLDRSRYDKSHPFDEQKLTEQFQGELQRMIPGIARERCEPECVVDDGYAADGILLLARRVDADLIVLGTRRSSHWFTSIRAGIAFDVIRAADCPVLTVRA